ncbi:MAG: acetyl-CoA carboxylase carboxyl transferase subunit alpha [Erysipelotrichaceae bacterium]|nr:acetyl-CoA carboxylase carboxyl transferase subunit alpha [Erysipelotrichaceae bacterium]
MVNTMNKLTPWQTVLKARDPMRPKGQDLIPYLFEDFTELKGDRCFGDDQALIGGIARFEGRPVTLLVQAKGRTLQENQSRNYGMMSPEGYRKAQRLMLQAEKFGRPVICIVDTPGAFPGRGAEERGQAQAIAECLKLSAGLGVPVITVVLSEGGSGGALALSAANEILFMENAVYSILSPEGFASILWKDETRREEAAAAMKLTSADLKRAGFADTVIKESPGSGAAEFAAAVQNHLHQALARYVWMQPDEVRAHRLTKIRNWGVPEWME